MRIPKSLALGTAIAFSAFAIGTENTPGRAQDGGLPAFEQTLRAEFSKSEGSALSAGFIDQGKLVWSKGFGTAGAHRTQAADSRTVYPVASVTKLLTGIMLLQLVDRKVVHLTDPVEKYVPELRRIQSPYPWTAPITLFQLATMTGGLTGSWQEPVDDHSWEQHLLDVIPKLQYVYEPGTRRKYSNVGYAILGLALSRAVDTPYARYVEREILVPLGMSDSSFTVQPGQESRLALPRTDVAPIRSWEHNSMLPAAGLFTTVEDLSKLMQFQMGLSGDRVLPLKALQESYRLVVPSDGDLLYGDGAGYAVVRNEDSNLVAVGHGGHLDGYIASYEFDGKTRRGFVILTSHESTAYLKLTRIGLKQASPNSTGGTGLPPLETH